MAHRLPLADIQFIADFATFARAKGDVEYGRCNASACALAQFGHPGVQHNDLRGVPEVAFSAAMGGDFPPRFTDLADRLEALIADSPVVVRS